MRYTKEQLLFYLKDFARRSRKITIKSVNADPKMPASSAFVARFGSWNKALLAAGIKTNRKRYGREELLESLRLLSKELGSSPCSSALKGKDWIASYSTYRKYFGSWKRALKEAGLAKAVQPNLGKFMR